MMLKKIHWSETACVEATGALANSGYVRVHSKVKKRKVYPHIEACVKAHGPRPSGKHTVDHLCKNKKCCNPHHLEWVTYSENNKRRKPFKLSRIPDATVLEALKRVRAGESQTDVAKSLGVRNDTLNHWMTGRSRAKLTGIVYSPRPAVIHD